MIETTNRELPRWRGKTFIALFTTAVALSGGAQALSPAPASALVDQGAVCTVDSWGWISCAPPPAGAESDDSAAPGDPDFAKSRKLDTSHGWSADYNNDPQQRDGNGVKGWVYEKTPREPEGTDERRMKLTWKCSELQGDMRRVRREGPRWYDRLWKLDKTKQEVLDDLLDEFEDLDCWRHRLH